MSIDLFEHNQKAYDAALLLMKETGKAAIVHPTGTGKSFIAFKLAEEHPKQRICWLSPSEYIFKTQIENVRSLDPQFTTANIQFFTYSKLMILDGEQIAEIQPDFIVFDEFHRCGATEWGKGVERLLAAYPDAQILGLSATNIRYLDNRRDMADELFDGNVASYMTLGEAIARDILLAPKYIISVYSYQKEIDRYRQRIRTTKWYGARRDVAEKQLEALRRALAQAEGLDVIFHKHMPTRCGKYIVFCAGKEHMDEMIVRVPEWFGKVDPEPHVYSLYADDPGTSQSFQDFKDDHSDHLKLLFCIDMLNEGVHVNEADGVILFRPTVSPIIYKQQIGRALSASKSCEPVIFDIVNNFENLASVDEIQGEIYKAFSTVQGAGESQEFDKTFKVIDEVRDCRKLFAELQQTLDVSWDTLYAEAKKYYESHGHLEVPRRYVTKSNLSLGSWISRQRKLRSGKAPGILTNEQIVLLDAIGMVWEDRSTRSWNKNYAQAEKYYRTHGNLDAVISYVTPDGFALGVWLSNLRSYRKMGQVSEDQVLQLDKIGMIWDKLELDWWESYFAAREYYHANASLDVPNKYVTPEGFKLGQWIARMRQLNKGNARGAELTPERIEALNSIGMLWDKYDAQWEQMYREAVQFFELHGHLQIPSGFLTPLGKRLDHWVHNQKTYQKQGKLSPERIAKLEAIGIKWLTDSWEERYQLAKRFYEVNGHLNMSQSYKTENGIWLGKWLYIQRLIFMGRVEGQSLTKKQIQRLNAIGMSWAIAEKTGMKRCSFTQRDDLFLSDSEEVS